MERKTVFVLSQTADVHLLRTHQIPVGASCFQVAPTCIDIVPGAKDTKRNGWRDKASTSTGSHSTE